MPRTASIQRPGRSTSAPPEHRSPAATRIESTGMIPRIIEYSIRNRFIVILLTAVMAMWGVYCAAKTPVAAITDLSENQVIVFADWIGRSPKEIDDQITYPLSVNLQGPAGVKSVRSPSEFNFPMIPIIFAAPT